MRGRAAKWPRAWRGLAWMALLRRRRRRERRREPEGRPIRSVPDQRTRSLRAKPGSVARVLATSDDASQDVNAEPGNLHRHDEKAKCFRRKKSSEPNETRLNENLQRTHVDIVESSPT